MLSVVWRIWPEFPGNILPMKVVSLSAGAIFLAFAYLLLCQSSNHNDLKSAVIVAICACAPATCDLANSVMSELIYGAFTMVALSLLDRELRHPVSPFLGVAIGALAGTAFLTRSVGIALLIAIIGGLVLRKNWRLLSTTTLGAVLVVVPVKAWEAPASGVGRSYEYYVNYTDWFRHTASDVGPLFFVWVPFKNLLSSVVGLSGTMLPSKIDLLPAGNLLNFALLGLLIAGAFAVLFTIIGLSVRIRQRPPDVWTLYLGCYLALLMIWPFPPPPRFFVPVLPLILAACCDGMSRTGWFAARTFRIPLAIVGLLALMTSFGVSTVERIAKAQVPIETERHYKWIIENSTPDDVIACIDDPNAIYSPGGSRFRSAFPSLQRFMGLTAVM